MADLEAVYERFRETPPPHRVVSTVEDVYEAIDEYDGYISGLVQTVLAGQPPSVARLNPGDDIEARLREAEDKMAALRAHWDRIRELTRTLVAVVERAE